MKLTRKQKIQQQREWAAERVMGPIRDAIERGELVITPCPLCAECGQSEPAHTRDDIGTCVRFKASGRGER